MSVIKYGEKKWLIATLVATMAISTNGVFNAFIIGNFINIASEGGYPELFRNIVLCILGLLGYYVANLIAIFSKNKLVYSCNMRIKRLLFSNAFERGYDLSSKESSSLLTTDIKQFETKGLLNEILIFQNIFTFVVALIYGFFLSVSTTIVFLLASCVPFIVSKLFSKKIEQASEEWSRGNSDYIGRLNDFMNGTDTIINYGVQKIALQNFSVHIANLESALLKMNNIVGVSTQTTISLANICLSGFSFGFGIYQVLSGRILLGSFISIVQISNYLANPILGIITSINEQKTTGKIKDRLVIAGKNQNQLVKQTGMKINKLSLRNASIRIDDTTLFDHLSIDIAAGEKVLITAPSGYGKSTLLLAIARLLEFNAGDYLINDKDISALDGEELAASFALIKQRPFIFDDTILFNITLGKDYQPEALEKAIEASQLTQIVQAKGLDFQVGEQGSNLSGGQLQRIEIARGILADRDVILADEITSALDHVTSEKISDYFLNQNKIVIEVAHKVSRECLSKYTQIIPLDKTHN